MARCIMRTSILHILLLSLVQGCHAPRMGLGLRAQRRQSEVHDTGACESSSFIPPSLSSRGRPQHHYTHASQPRHQRRGARRVVNLSSSRTFYTCDVSSPSTPAFLSQPDRLLKLRA
eukprot:766161-Hanusia_phi.AAC.2